MLVILAELRAPWTIIMSTLRIMVMVCTWGIPTVVLRSYNVLKEFWFCSAVTCGEHTKI